MVLYIRYYAFSVLCSCAVRQVTTRATDPCDQIKVMDTAAAMEVPITPTADKCPYTYLLSLSSCLVICM